MPRAWRPAILVTAVLALATAAVCVVFWPGQMDPDTLDAIQQAATGQYGDFHAPLLSLLWRGPYLLGLTNPGWILALGVFSLCAGMYLVLRIALSRVPALIATLACLAFPPVLSWGVHVGRDTWLTAFTLCGFGLAGRMVRHPGRSHRATLVGAVAMGVLAQLSRQNALPVVAVLFVTVAAIELPDRIRRRAVVAVGVGAVGAVTLFAAESFVAYPLLNVRSQHPAQFTYALDLSLLSEQQGRMLLPPSVYPSQDLHRLTDLVTPQGSDTLFFASANATTYPFDETTYRTLAQAWRTAVIHDPVGYLRARLRVSQRLLAMGHTTFWVFQYPPVAAPYSPLSSNLEQAGIDYLIKGTQDGNNAIGGPLYTVWAYGIVLVVAAIALMLRPGRGRVASALAVSMVAYTCSTFLLAPEAIYRYVYPMVVAAVVVGVVAVGFGISTLRPVATRPGTGEAPSAESRA